MTEEKKYFTYIDTITGNKDMEKIIIDGVNVAGCNDFYKEWDNWEGKDNYRCQDYLSGICEGNDCYYKQLQRLKQENEELKEDLKLYSEWLDEERKSREFWYDKLLPFRKALEEIREIANQTNCKNKLTEYTVADLSTMQNKFSEILNKIDEVLQ